MKGTFLFIACSFAIIGFVSSQTCQQQDNCDACTATSGCGWCAATKSCLPGTAHGPNNSTCIGRSWEFGSCTPCQSFGDCRECLEYDADCFWCANANNGQGGCKAIGFVGCPYTRSCPCNIYADCGSCIDDPTCQWCSEDSACVSSNSTCSAPQPSFNFTTSCPCFINRDCSSCRAGPNCKWCLSGNCDENCAGGWSNSCENYCQSFGNCETCTSQPGCSWCPQTGQCVDPTTASCAFANSCPNCIAATYCDACIESPYCVWCEDSRSCQQKGTQCLIAYGCESYCNQISDCDTCNTIKGCGWCENEKRCSDSTTATCLLAHTCSAPHCGFSGGSFVGGMALMGGIILILVIGYSFYRWRTGSKITYREMM